MLDGGGNDAFFGGSSGLTFEQLAKDAATSLLTAIKRLESHGARNFLVPNKPDLSHSPYARNNLNDTARADLDTFAKVFSQTISTEWKKILGKQVKITLVDQNSILDGVAHHFDNIKDACLTGVYAGVDDGKRTLCKDPQNYLFCECIENHNDRHCGGMLTDKSPDYWYVHAAQGTHTIQPRMLTNCSLARRSKLSLQTSILEQCMYEYIHQLNASLPTPSAPASSPLCRAWLCWSCLC